MRRGLTFPELCVGLLFVAIAALACLSPAQPDTFWALRAGEDVWRTGRVALVETYSHTAAGRPWPDHEWLWQALAYGLYRMGGLPLLTLGVAALVTSAYAVAYRLMAGSAVMRVLIVICGLTLATNAWSLRPQVASLLMLALLLALLVRGRVWLIPPLFVLWANLHGGPVVVMGTALMVAATATALVWERRRFLPLAAATGLGVAATFVTPLGPGLWRFMVRWALTTRHTGVSEWDPVTPLTAPGIVFWLLALAFVALTARRWRHARAWEDRLPVVAALVLLPLAARSVRNVGPFLLVAMVACSRLAAAVPSARQRPPRVAERSRFNLAFLAVAAAAGAAAIVACWRAPAALLGWRPISPAAAAAIAACPAPIYNGYNQGGVLIWFVRQQPVFVDGRHDPYPPELLVEDREVEQGGDHRALFARTGVRCAALSARAILAGHLRAAGWRPRFADEQWVVLEPP
jgi:hypothetical protein